MDSKVLTSYDTWCYTTSNTSSRRRVKRGKSKAHRAKEKLMIKKGELN